MGEMVEKVNEKIKINDESINVPKLDQNECFVNNDHFEMSKIVLF